MRSTLQTKLLLAGLLCTLVAGTAAAVPELAITPTTVNLTGNHSIPANVAQPVEFTVTNQNDTNRIYNVSLPTRDWLTWSANHFDLNASQNRTITATLTRNTNGTVTDDLTVPYYYNQTRSSNATNQTWELTFDKNFYPDLSLAIESFYRNTTLATTSLDYAFTLDLGQSGSSVFKLTNTGPEAAQNLQVHGDNLTFDTDAGFSIPVDGESYISFTAQIDEPQTNPTAATNQTYELTIEVTGSNINTTTIPINVTVPFTNYTTIETDEQDIGGLLEKFEQFCQTNNCSAVRQTVYRNRTVYVNQTPVYEANFSNATLRQLENLTEYQYQNWKAVSERQNLLKNAMNTRFENVTSELNQLEKRNARETTELREDVQNLTRQMAATQHTQVRQENHSKLLGWILLGIAVLCTLIFGGYRVVKYVLNRENDNRVIVR